MCSISRDAAASARNRSGGVAWAGLVCPSGSAQCRSPPASAGGWAMARPLRPRALAAELARLLTQLGAFLTYLSLELTGFAQQSSQGGPAVCMKIHVGV
jgi:hypothetical protein